MNDPDDTQVPPDPFEAELAARLRGLVQHELPPYDLAARAQARAGADVAAHRRRSLARGGGAVLLAAAAVWAIVAIGTGIADRDSGISTVDGPSSTVRSSTTTSSSSTTSTTRADGDEDDDRGTVTTTTLLDRVVVMPTPPEPRCTDVVGPANTAHDDWAADDGASGPTAYWRTQPAEDAPMRLRLCVDDITPAVGQTVRVTLTADDPDQVLDAESCNAPRIEWGDSARILSLCNDTPSPPPATPGTTPKPGDPGHVELAGEHQYAEAGELVISGSATSGPDTGGPYPYASSAHVQIPITVHAP